MSGIDNMRGFFSRAHADAPFQGVRKSVVRYQGHFAVAEDDYVVEEAHFKLSLDGRTVDELACSPWNLEELAVGRLYSGGLICGFDRVKSVEIDRERGLIGVETRAESLALHGQVIPFTNVVALRDAGVPSEEGMYSRVRSTLRLDPDDISSRIALLERESDLFHLTGGVHSAALSCADGMIARFEDVGRHNALDKLMGWCVMCGVRTDDKVLLFSGRVPQEIMLKVIRLGVPAVVSPGAPTGLSVDLAEEYGVTLVGFAKRGRFNVYSHPERIAGASAVAL